MTPQNRPMFALDARYASGRSWTAHQPATASGTPPSPPSVALRLSALTADAWRRIAVRRSQGQYDWWDYDLPFVERVALERAQEAGAVLTAHRRGANGGWELVARLSRERRGVVVGEGA